MVKKTDEKKAMAKRDKEEIQYCMMIDYKMYSVRLVITSTLDII